VPGVGGNDELALAYAQQVILAQQALHALQVDRLTLMAQRSRDSWAAINGPLQRDALNGIMQVKSLPSAAWGGGCKRSFCWENLLQAVKWRREGVNPAGLPSLIAMEQIEKPEVGGTWVRFKEECRGASRCLRFATDEEETYVEE
jgi:hypothetical protein